MATTALSALGLSAGLATACGCPSRPPVGATATAAVKSETGIEPAEIFVSGEGGDHTYRIPALVTTKAGTILAFCEGRKNSASDRGDIDGLLRRLQDGGRTWSAMRRMRNDGPNTCGNPCAVVDQDTGDIWRLLTWNEGQRHESDTKAGFGEDSRRVFVTHAEDDGVTWAAPAAITAQVKDARGSGYATGPGAGIQIRQGKHRGWLNVHTVGEKLPRKGRWDQEDLGFRNISIKRLPDRPAAHLP